MNSFCHVNGDDVSGNAELTVAASFSFPCFQISSSAVSKRSFPHKLEEVCLPSTLPPSALNQAMALATVAHNLTSSFIYSFFVSFIHLCICILILILFF